MTSLRTERLLLRQFREDDLDAYAAMMADPEVMRYIGAGKTRDRDEAWTSMAWCLGHWTLRGYGFWAVEEAASGTLIGRIGLLNPEGWPGLEVGWLLARTHWGRGLATEGARAALDFAFEVVGADRVISLMRPANTPSIRVAERLGERLESRIEILGDDALVYAIDRPAWERGRSRP